jgi:hypothetical protein
VSTKVSRTVLRGLGASNRAWLLGTVVNWHRAGFRLYWTWVSRISQAAGGKRVSEEVRALIVRMVAENPTWGAPRIHREPLKLGSRSRKGVSCDGSGELREIQICETMADVPQPRIVCYACRRRKTRIVCASRSRVSILVSIFYGRWCSIRWLLRWIQRMNSVT